MGDKIFKNGFFGNQHVSADAVASSKLSTARLATVSKIAGPASAILSFVLAANLVQREQDGLITRQERDIELTKIGVPIVLGLISAPVGLTVEGGIFTHDVFIPIVTTEARQMGELLNGFTPQKPTESFFQVLQRKIQSKGLNAENESEF